MADNRMYLRCSVCGEEIILGKRFDVYYTDSIMTNANKLNKFFEKHNHFEYGRDAFELSFESKREYYPD